MKVAIFRFKTCANLITRRISRLSESWQRRMHQRFVCVHVVVPHLCGSATPPVISWGLHCVCVCSISVCCWEPHQLYMYMCVVCVKVYGVWCVVYGEWYIMSGVWWVVYGEWCMVSGTVGANKKFTFRFHSTVVLRCEPFRSVFTESSVFAEVRLLIQQLLACARNG